jgi:hypothetical protein
MELDQRRIALAIARARAVNGLVMIVLPGIVARTVFGEHGRHPAVRAALRMVGVRDLVLGVGAITTLKENTMDAEWVGMGAVADGVDALVTLLSPGIPTRARLVAFAGASSAVTGYQASRALAAQRAPKLGFGSDIDS